MAVPQDFIYADNSSNPINNKTALHNAGKVSVNDAHEKTKSVTVNKDMIRRKEEPYLTMKKTTSTSLNKKCCETHFFLGGGALKYRGRQLLNYDFYDFW